MILNKIVLVVASETLNQLKLCFWFPEKRFTTCPCYRAHGFREKKSIQFCRCYKFKKNCLKQCRYPSWVSKFNLKFRIIRSQLYGSKKHIRCSLCSSSTFLDLQNFRRCHAITRTSANLIKFTASIVTLFSLALI